MISFRYHIVSIVSVFLALAVGVALGGGPLKGEVDSSLVEQVEADRNVKADLREEIAALRSIDEFNDTFARTAAPGMINGALQGRVVTMLVLPGASDDEAASIGRFVSEAGGTVGGTLRVGEELIDVSNKQLVEELGSQLLDGTPGVTVPDDASGYERMGALVARAIGTPQDAGAGVDETSDGILSGLSTAGLRLLSADGELDRRGSLVLLVAGSGEGTVDEQKGANSIVISLAKAIDADTEGVVVAGPVASALGDGLVSAVRADGGAARELSTVDALPTTAAELVTVMALSGQAGGDAGHYGAVDAPDGAMPGAVDAPQ